MTKKTPSAIRQHQILDAALKIIGQQGLANLNMADLAHEIEIAPSNLYRHYKNKEAILDAVLAHIQRNLEENLREAENQIQPLEKIYFTLHKHAEMVKNTPVLLQVMVTGAHYSKKTAVQSIFGNYRQHLCTWIQAAQAEKQLSAEYTAESIFLLLLGLVMPAAAMLNMSVNLVDPVVHLNTHWKTLVHSLKEDQDLHSLKS